MVKKYSVEERRNEICELILNEGLFSINKSALGRKYGVSDVMIGKNIDIILKKIPKEKIEDIIDKIYVQYMHILITNEKLLMSEDENIKLKAINSIIKVINEYLKFLKYVAKDNEYTNYKSKQLLGSTLNFN